MFCDFFVLFWMHIYKYICSKTKHITDIYLPNLKIAITLFQVYHIMSSLKNDTFS